jgi:plastocyanin
MASIDKVGMVVAIAIVAIFLGVAASMSAAQDAGPAVSTPKPVVVEEPAEQVMELEEEIAMEETSEEETMMEESAGPTTVHVEIPLGTSVPGCEETNECWSPADVTINAGDTVHWMNLDTAAHTVTGGSPADGPSGVFDSSLVMVDATYEFTFDDAGSYDYFCMVHPWMVGSVTVN